ncbi:MAG: response regulator, partial [Eubacteriales bacterium]|nr:response regulator [Eubacteriales bacterium]
MYRLVVIDDEFMVVEGIKAMIARQHLNYEVTGAAYNGIDGLALVQEQKPDLVITDIRIPGLDGLSLIEAAREFCPDTTFVVISGYTEFEYARRALALGVRGYIDKPISMEKLKSVLDRVELEWAEKSGIREEKSGDIERARYRELEEKMDASIRDLTRMDLEAFRTNSNEVKEKTRALYRETGDFRREMYKYLCVIGDILREERPKIDREELVSYKEMEKQQTPEEILAYTDQVLSYIFRFLSANQTGSGHRTIAELLEYIEH